MKTITVKTSKTYDITVGTNLLDDAGRLIRQAAGGQSAIVVTDDNVEALYAGRMSDALARGGYQVFRFVIPHGEASKNGDRLLSLLNHMAELQLTRTDVVVALGGGVVGDFAGFAAACYMRGVRFIQVPTTLLAAVDSSVGGKTAIDLPAGKNLAGAFYQPDAVICDVSLLATLPPDVFRDGCAEVIKHGVIADPALFTSLETPIETQLEQIVARNVIIKRDIVAQDEFENGVRKLLNLGHTVGHAIELLSKYRVSHGHAVATGMAVAAGAAARMGICDRQCLLDIKRMLVRYSLPDGTPYAADKLAQACLSDKKRDGGDITMVFPAAIGTCVLKKIPVGELESVIRMGLER